MKLKIVSGSGTWPSEDTKITTYRICHSELGAETEYTKTLVEVVSQLQ
jgi:hypothetical protein